MADLVGPPPALTDPVDSTTGKFSRPWLVWLQQIPNAAKTLVVNGAAALLKANNLSDVADQAASRVNLGLGTAATHAVTDFDSAGAAASAVATFSATLGTAAYQPSSAFDAAGAATAAQTASLQKSANLSDVASVSTARTSLGLGSGLSVTVALAKLTAGGANGSATFTNGILTAKVDPT